MAIEKLIIKVRNEDLSAFIEKGFILEAMVDKYFSGNTMYFMCMYLSAERRKAIRGQRIIKFSPM